MTDPAPSPSPAPRAGDTFDWPFPASLSFQTEADTTGFYDQYRQYSCYPYALESGPDVVYAFTTEAGTIKVALEAFSGDLDSARQLAEEKTVMRKLERESQDKHLARLKSGQAESIESSDMHLEVVRALKEINSLIAKVAYPILKESGQLLDSRLAS